MLSQTDRNALLRTALGEYENNRINASTTARLMLEWEQLMRELSRLECYITDAVMAAQETVTTGNVRATYNAGRKRYDYKTPAQQAPDDVIAAHTVTVTKTDWRTIALQELGLPKEDLEFTQSSPSVTIKLL